MKDLSLPPRIGDDMAWVQSCFDEIEQKAQEDIDSVIADFSVTGTLTQLRTIDAGTATLAQLRNFVCTLIVDMQKKGQNRNP